MAEEQQASTRRHHYADHVLNTKGVNDVASEFREALDGALDDLTSVTARWMVAGLLVLDLVLMGAVLVADHGLKAHDLLVVGVGVLVFGALALTAAVLLGDFVRVVRLRTSGVGLDDLKHRRTARRLSVRSAALTLVFVALMTTGPRLMLSLLAG